MADRELKSKGIPLGGKLVTNVDPTLIGGNFQELKNLRYTDTNIRGVKGMTKINSTVLSNPKIRNGFHFKKDQPSESHVLVQAFNSGDTSSSVYENTTAIPSTGDFTATALHTDASTGTGRFSKAPNGNVAYCNSSESLIWGGDEHFSSGFVNYDPDGSWTSDYTTKVQNTLTDSNNIATLFKADGSIPANTGLLLHLDNNVTDSSSSAHTVTNNNVTFTTTSKFGTHAAVFNGTNAYLTIPDHADFDFSGGNFTIDLWFKPTSTGGTLFSQATDANNYIQLYYNSSSLSLALEIYSAGSLVVADRIALSFLPNVGTGEYHHLEVSEDGNNWYMFVDGKLVYWISDTDRAANYTGEVYIGAFYDGSTVSDYFNGNIDELRIGKATLHTNFFEPRQVPYGTDAAYLYVGSVRPLRGAKFYVETANTTTSSVNVMEWKNFVSTSPAITTTGLWVDTTTITDGTASGGISLAQTGSIAFDDTSSTSKPRLINNTYLYWYNFIFTDIDDTAQISQVTLDMSMQKVRDLWNGEIRQVSYFEVNTGTNAYDNTINVFEGTYDSANSATYSDLSALPVAGYLLVGFTERISALDIRFLAGETNSTDSRPMRVSYWDGSTQKALSLTQEKTFSSGTLSQSGVVAWTPSDIGDESKQELGGKPPLYYYKIQAGILLSATTKVYYIGGIPAQRQIDGYKFPLLSHDRFILCSNQDDKKNSILIAESNTTSAFNGTGSREISFGNDDELIAGTELYGELQSDLYKLTILCKLTETWLLNELEGNNFEYYRLSDEIGCTAPLTMTSIHIPSSEELPAVHGAIWQATDSIYFYDGREFEPIHRDIEDVFGTINTSMLSRSVGFLDPINDEWHWLIATGASTTLNEEWVFDIKRRKWYQIDRLTYLNCGFPVVDTNGKSYTYGCTDTGYMERLENGLTFDGQDRVFSFQMSDFPLSDSIMYESILKHYKLVSTSMTTTNTIAVTHYGDGKISGTSMPVMAAGETGKRIANITKTANQHEASIFHSLKFQLTNNTDTDGFEPLWLGIFYKDIRESRR